MMAGPVCKALIMNQISLIKRAGRMLFLVAVVFLLLFVLVGVGLIFVDNVSVNQIEKLNQFTTTLNFYSQFLRWIFYLALVFFWKPIITFVGKFRQWDSLVIDRALNGKKSALILLLAVELLVFQQLPTLLINYWR